MNWLLSLIILFSFGQKNSEESIYEKIYRESNFVVYLEVGTLDHRQDEQGNLQHYMNWSRLTGFFVRDEDGVWLWTAGHVIMYGIDHLREPHIAYFRSDLNKIPQELEFYGYDESIDIALFKLKNEEAVNNLTLARFGQSEDILIGQQVISIICPPPLKFYFA